MPCQPSRRLKLVAEIYLCIRNEREEQTRQPPEFGSQPLTHPLSGWMREAARHAAELPGPRSKGPTPLPRSAGCGHRPAGKGLEYLLQRLVWNAGTGIK